MSETVDVDAPALATAHPMARPVASRLASVDVLRGVAMVLMALDHVRAYFGLTDFDPVDVAATTPAYFFTRWITHFVAPIFVLLAGTAAYLQLQRGKSKAELSHFLWTRGLWLVVLEFTVVAVGWVFDVPPAIFFAQVIWAIGWSMIALAALVRLPVAWVGAIGVAIILLHNATDGLAPEAFGAFAPLWQFLHVESFWPVGGSGIFFAYPVLPWIGVMAAGFALGQVYTMEEARRRRVLLVLGAAVTALFFVLRGINLYGDPAPWSTQPDAVRTLLSFLNLEKYPPSLLFLSMTLGPALVLLALLERVQGAAAGFLAAFGRAPLYYYVVHIYAIHALAIVAALLAGSDASTFYGPQPAGGYFLLDPQWPLPFTYVVWVGVVLALYPSTRWWGDLKRRRKDWWLSYL